MSFRQSITPGRVALALVIITGAALFLFLEPVRSFFGEIALFLTDVVKEHRILGIFVFILLSVVSAMFSTVSTVPLIPLAVSVWGPMLSMIILVVGWSIGDFAAYSIGSFAGYPLAKRFVSNRKLSRWEEHFEKGTAFIPAFLFRLATPAETGYLFGILRFPLGQYAIITLVSEVLYAVMAVYASEALLEQRIAAFSLLVLGVAALIAAASMTYFRFYRPAKFRKIVETIKHPIEAIKK